MQQTRPQPGFIFWVFWILATTIGWTVGFAILGASQNLLLTFLGNGIFAYGSAVFVTFFGSGVFVGLLQWLILRRYLPKSLLWVFLSAPGWALSWSLVLTMPWAFILLSNPPSFNLFALIAGLFGGLLAGVLQYFVLRGHVRASLLWLPVGILYTTVGILVFYNVPRVEYAFGIISRTLAGGLVSGILSASGLLFLLRQPPPTAPAPHLADTKPNRVINLNSPN